jgi:hypothetical protein
MSIKLYWVRIGTLPFRYMEIPIHFRKLKNGEWKHVEACFEKCHGIDIGCNLAGVADVQIKG